jgi:hypothetical protein
LRGHTRPLIPNTLLMVRHRDGVTVTKTLPLARLDSDYFDPGAEVQAYRASRVMGLAKRWSGLAKGLWGRRERT